MLFPYHFANTSSVQGALEWLETNQDKSYEEIVAASDNAASAHDDDPNAEPAPLQPGEQARSLVCNECGKKFRSQAQAEFHASKTQHVDFAESQEELAPLTEEEKKAKLEELRKKLAEKRAGTSEQDKLDKKRNEASYTQNLRTTHQVTNYCVGNSTKEYQGNTRHQGGTQEEGAAQGSRSETKGKAG